jgi:hypothetical protein
MKLIKPLCRAHQVRAAKSRDKRPEFDRLLKEVVRRKIDLVAAWSVGRLGL